MSIGIPCARAAEVARAFLCRDLQVALSYREPFLVDLAGVVFVMVEFFFVAKIVPATEVPGGCFAFVTVGMVLSAVATAGISLMAVSVRQEQSQGTFELMLCAGLPARTLALGVSAYPMVTAIARAAGYLLIAVLLGAGFSEANWPLAFVALALGSVSFTGLGLLAVGVVLVARQGAGIAAWIISIMTLAAGVAFPLRVLPGWLQTLGSFSPVTRALAVLRGAMTSGVGIPSVARDLIVLAAVAVGFAALGVGAVAVGCAGVEFPRFRGHP